VFIDDQSNSLRGLSVLVTAGRTDIGFDVDANEVTILAAHHSDGRSSAHASRAGEEPVIAERHVPRANKAQVAEAILDTVRSLRRGQPQRTSSRLPLRHAAQPAAAT
jgi:hypothetical protein